MKCFAIEGTSADGDSPRVDLPRSLLPLPARRRGVTLIELLIVMLIISILAALVLGVAAVAMETARQAQSTAHCRAAAYAADRTLQLV